MLADPRRSELARHATHYLQFKPDTDVALLNAMMHTIVAEGLVDAKFVADRTSGYEELARNVAAFSAGGDGAGLRHPGRDDPHGRADVRDVARGDDPLGHGHLAARARHRQRALPDRAHDADGPGRAARHRTASAARPEQRAGRVRRRAHPDDVPRLPARRQRHRAREVRGAVGRHARPEARPHRRRDHGRRARGRDPRHVRHGREPRDVRPGRQPRAGGARGTRDARRAGHLPHRDRVSRRRRPAGVGVSREDRHVHEHRPHGAARAAGARAAGRRAAGPRDHRRHGHGGWA